MHRKKSSKSYNIKARHSNLPSRLACCTAASLELRFEALPLPAAPALAPFLVPPDGAATGADAAA